MLEGTKYSSSRWQLLRTGFQRLSQVVRKVSDGLLYKEAHLFFVQVKELLDCWKKRYHDQFYGMIKGDLRNLLNIQVKQFSERPVICVLALEHTEHHISHIDYGKMRFQRIKGCALTFLCVFQILFAGLEKDLDSLCESSYNRSRCSSRPASPIFSWLQSATACPTTL